MATADDDDSQSAPPDELARRDDDYAVLLPEPAEKISQQIWRTAKRYLPPIVTGAWSPADGDDGASMALYNLFFIRVPILAATAWYVRDIVIGGGSLELDVGLGPFELPPGIVLAIAGIMLLPVL